MDKITFRCPFCDAPAQAVDDGSRVQCFTCHASLMVVRSGGSVVVTAVREGERDDN